MALSEEEKDWPVGEAGTLKRVWKHERMDRCLFLFIEHKTKEYTSMMYFDDPKFCGYILFLLDRDWQAPAGDRQHRRMRISR